MTVPNILAHARALTNTSESMTNFTDSDLLPFLNMVYHEVENEIVRGVGDDYFTAEFYTNTVADQERYAWDISGATVVGFKKLKELMIKFKETDTNYTILKEMDTNIDSVSNDRDAESSSGKYDIRGQYIHIYPTPKESVTEGLRVTAVVNLVDLTATDTEDLVFPDHTELRVYHEILVKGLMPYIYQIKGDTNRKNDSRAEYRQDLDQMIQQMKNRSDEAMVSIEPNLSYFKS